MEIPRGLPKIIEPIDSNPIDSVGVLAVLKNFATENRRYWRLRDILRSKGERWTKSSSYFRLQNETWRFFSLHDTKTYFGRDRILIRFHNFFNEAAVDQFNVGTGVLTETGELITEYKAKTSSDMFLACIWMDHSKLEWMKQSSKDFILFVEVKRKDHGKEHKIRK